jgi:acyl CoA:acetate/3-ketoacid CoA transferase beta subunit
MNPKKIKHYIATRVAKELKDGDVVSLGIGLPTLVPSYLPKNVHVGLRSENGVDCSIMDLVVGSKKVIVAMEHTAKGNPKILTKCRLPLTAINCVDMVVTEMGVFEITENRLLLTEYNPEYSVDDIRAVTEADVSVSDDLKPMSTTGFIPSPFALWSPVT